MGKRKGSCGRAKKCCSNKVCCDVDIPISDCEVNIPCNVNIPCSMNNTCNVKVGCCDDFSNSCTSSDISLSDECSTAARSTRKCSTGGGCGTNSGTVVSFGGKTTIVDQQWVTIRSFYREFFKWYKTYYSCSRQIKSYFRASKQREAVSWYGLFKTTHKQLYSFHKEFRAQVAVWKKTTNYSQCHSWCKKFYSKFYACISVHKQLYSSLCQLKNTDSCFKKSHSYFSTIIESTKTFSVKWVSVYGRGGSYYSKSSCPNVDLAKPCTKDLLAKYRIPEYSITDYPAPAIKNADPPHRGYGGGDGGRRRYSFGRRYPDYYRRGSFSDDYGYPRHQNRYYH